MKFGDILLNFCEWVWRFMILNFLWVVFTVLGGVVLGIMPATTSVFYILRKWVQGDLDLHVFKTFKEIYKNEFVNTNKCGIVFFVLFAFLAFDLAVLYNIEAIYSTFLYMLVMAVLFFVSIAFMFFFPTYVHFKLSNKEYIKNSFILAVTSPFQTLLIFIGFFILFYSVQSNLGFAVFFFLVVPGYLVMHVMHKKFIKLQQTI